FPTRRSSELETARVVRHSVECHRQGRPSDAAPPVLLGETPLGRHGLGPAAQKLAVVHVLEGGSGVEDAQADVARSVTHTEDPAVAGQEYVLVAAAVPQLEPGLQVVVVVAWALEVGTHGHTHGSVVTLADPHGHREPGGVSVCGHDQR